jgi:hypothetical protein
MIFLTAKSYISDQHYACILSWRCVVDTQSLGWNRLVGHPSADLLRELERMVTREILLKYSFHNETPPADVLENLVQV